jgi:transcription elongation factor Elf1
MHQCPHCNSTNVIIIDINDPPNLFECGACNHRFHTIGFEPSEIDASVSLTGFDNLKFNYLLGK